ncbi:MAG: hypothetical protein WC641_05545 [Patescibacteria group bacterium]
MKKFLEQAFKAPERCPYGYEGVKPIICRECQGIEIPPVGIFLNPAEQEQLFKDIERARELTRAENIMHLLHNLQEKDDYLENDPAYLELQRLQEKFNQLKMDQLLFLDRLEDMDSRLTMGEERERDYKFFESEVEIPNEDEMRSLKNEFASGQPLLKKYQAWKQRTAEGQKGQP